MPTATTARLPRRRPSLLRRTLRALVVTLVAAAGLGAAGPAWAASSAAGAGSALGRGFSLRPGPYGDTLVWSGGRVPVGDARPQLRLGTEVLGSARELDGGLTLTLTPAEAGRVRASSAALQVWSGGRRLDGATPWRATAGPGAATVAGATPTPTVPTDPAAPGPYRTKRLSYSLTSLVVRGFAAPIEVQAEVTRPVGATDRMPLVMLLHGRHSTCFRGGPSGDASGAWPCPSGWAPIPSYLGYRYVTDVLASQGYLAVSISANGINGQDYAALDAGTSARSQLVRHHLDLWAGWNAKGTDPWGGIFRGKVDMQQVVLVGHSRGGEGVNRAAVDASAADPYRIVGLASYGPTAFGRQVTPDVTSATILPTCDGDVSDLQGQAYADASRDLAVSPALRSAVVAVGANHNYFNTEWTPGLAKAQAFDDWFDSGDPTCGDAGSVRLTAQEQRGVGAAYTLALVRLAVKHQAKMLPLLDGSWVKPAAIGRAEIAVNAVGGNATLLYRPEAAGKPVLSGGLTGGECRGYLSPTVHHPTQAACGGDRSSFVTPHWQSASSQETRPAPQALELTWSAADGVARMGLPAASRDLRGYDSIDLRVANDPGRAPARLGVRIRDVRGAVATLPLDVASVAGWPGTGSLQRVQARTLRADLASAGAVDLQRVVAVELVTRSAGGHVWVLDVSAARHTVPRPVPLDLPRVSVETAAVAEGDGQPVSAVVKVRVDHALTAPATVWLQSQGSFSSLDGHALNLPAGASGVVATLPFTVVGDTVYTPRDPSYIDWATTSVGAVTGAVTGEYLGGLRTIEDDPAPTLTVSQASVTGAEGGSLHWTLSLSQPTTYLFYFVKGAASGGAELDTDDVDATWLENQTGTPPPVPAVPLWQQFGGAGASLFVQFEPGQTTASLDIPLRQDTTAEVEESVHFDVSGSYPDDPTLPPGGLTLTGTVPAT